MFTTYIKNTDSVFGTGATIEESENNAVEAYLEKYPEEEKNIGNVEWDTIGDE